MPAQNPEPRRHERPRLDALGPGESDNDALIVFHRIEDTAGHCGHMDLTRAPLDGWTGR